MLAVAAAALMGVAGCAATEGIEVQPAEETGSVTVPAAEVTLTRDWPVATEIPPDFDVGLDPDDTDPIYPEGQNAFREALADELTASLRPDAGASGRSAELVLDIARVRGDWDGTYPDDNAPRTQREEDIDLLADAVVAVIQPSRGERFAAAIEGELVIRRGETIVRREPVRVRTEVNQAVSDRDELAEVLGQLTSRSSAAIKKRIRTLAQSG